MRGFFLRRHFKDIFIEIEAFLKISILFEDISREIGLFLIVKIFQRLHGFLKKKCGIEDFLK
jgi:hypothetical protein